MGVMKSGHKPTIKLSGSFALFGIPLAVFYLSMRSQKPKHVTVTPIQPTLIKLMAYIHSPANYEIFTFFFLKKKYH